MKKTFIILNIILLANINTANAAINDIFNSKITAPKKVEKPIEEEKINESPIKIDLNNQKGNIFSTNKKTENLISKEIKLRSQPKPQPPPKFIQNEYIKKPNNINDKEFIDSLAQQIIEANLSLYDTIAYIRSQTKEKTIVTHSSKTVLTKETNSSYSKGFPDFLNSISIQESDGNYDLINSRTGATGKYQIMPSNWPSWAKQAGLPSNAPMTPQNQEIVARFKLKQYYDWYGAEGAAVAWYAGGLNGARWVANEPYAIGENGPFSWDAKQGNGDEPSVREYVNQVISRLKNPAKYTPHISQYVERTKKHTKFRKFTNKEIIELEKKTLLKYALKVRKKDPVYMTEYNKARAKILAKLKKTKRYTLTQALKDFPRKQTNSFYPDTTDVAIARIFSGFID